MDKIRCDVAVIGAGAAGIAAAVAAAESGVNVMLIEQYGFTGGLATTAMVGTLCGIYYRREEQNKNTPRYAVQGFAKQFAEGVMNKSNTQPQSFAEGLHFIPYQPSAFHHQAAQDLKQAGVQLLLHTVLVGVKVREEQVVELVVNTTDNVLSVIPASVIDCSGNAQIAMLAGLGMIKQPHYQSGAFVFKVSGLPEMEYRLLSLNLIRWVKRGIDCGDLGPYCERLSIIPGTEMRGASLLKLSMPESFKANSFQLTEYELDARTRCLDIVAFLRGSEPLLKDLSIESMATQVGIRTGPRHEGVNLLEEEQVMTCAKPKDGVAIGAWPIEYWSEQRKPDMSYFTADDCYYIPAGTLVSKHLNNLFFAGRTISATERAIASARVIGTCLSTGYAAGLLATEFVQKGKWQTGIEAIRTKQIYAVEV